MPADRSVIPVEVAFIAAGSPVVDRFARPDLGECAVCAAVSVPTVPLPSVVSEKFTDYDRLVRGGDRLCAGCAWALREPDNRLLPRVIDQDGSVAVGWLDAATVLMDPVPSTRAVMVPLAGRKHLLPFATWGSVTTDAAQVPWGAGEVSLLAAVLTLRSVKCSEDVLRAGMTPSLLHAPAASWGRVVAAFEVARVWRGSPAFDVALRVTRPRGHTADVEVLDGE